PGFQDGQRGLGKRDAVISRRSLGALHTPSWDGPSGVLEIDFFPGGADCLFGPRGSEDGQFQSVGSSAVALGQFGHEGGQILVRKGWKMLDRLDPRAGWKDIL